jgi:hypothetical protein
MDNIRHMDAIYLHDDQIRQLQEGLNDDSDSSEEDCPFQ